MMMVPLLSSPWKFGVLVEVEWVWGSDKEWEHDRLRRDSAQQIEEDEMFCWMMGQEEEVDWR